MEYTIDIEHHVTANLADCWTWEVDWADGNAAGTTYVDEATARKCAQAVIDALSPQPTIPALVTLTAEQADALIRWSREQRRPGGCSGYGPTFNGAMDVADALNIAESSTTPTDADAIVDELMSRKRAGQQKRSLAQPTTTTPTDALRDVATAAYLLALDDLEEGLCEDDIGLMLTMRDAATGGYCGTLDALLAKLATPQPTTPTDAHRKAARELLRNLTVYRQQRRIVLDFAETDIQLLAQAIADERERCAKAAVEARDWLMKGCRSNGAWLGYEMMKAHDILVRAVGDGRSEAAAPPERQCIGCDCLYVGDGYGDGWCSHLCAHDNPSTTPTDADAIVDDLMSRKRAGQQKRSLAQPTTPTDAEREAARRADHEVYLLQFPADGGS